MSTPHRLIVPSPDNELVPSAEDLLGRQNRLLSGGIVWMFIS